MLVLLTIVFLYDRIIRSVDHALQLSQMYDVPTLELGHVFVLFFFSVVVGLIDTILDDWGAQKSSLDVSSLAFVSTDRDDMDIDSTESHNLGRKEHRGEMRSMNSLKALEVLGKLSEGRKAVLLLRLVHFNMYACNSSYHMHDLCLFLFYFICN